MLTAPPPNVYSPPVHAQPRTRTPPSLAHACSCPHGAAHGPCPRTLARPRAGRREHAHEERQEEPLLGRGSIVVVLDELVLAEEAVEAQGPRPTRHGLSVLLRGHTGVTPCALPAPTPGRLGGGAEPLRPPPAPSRVLSTPRSSQHRHQLGMPMERQGKRAQNAAAPPASPLLEASSGARGSARCRAASGWFWITPRPHGQRVARLGPGEGSAHRQEKESEGSGCSACRSPQSQPRPAEIRSQEGVRGG